MMNRRQFLQLGATSTVALTATSLTATLTGCSESLPSNSKYRVLRAKDREFIVAVAPVMLNGHFPTDPIQRETILHSMLLNIDTAIFKLGPHNQKQFKDLLNLLNFGLSRGLTTGVWSQWKNASEEEINHFLNRWRESGFELFNMAYNGLNKLMAATFYGHPIGWQLARYPGPPYADTLITKNNN